MASNELTVSVQTLDDDDKHTDTNTATTDAEIDLTSDEVHKRPCSSCDYRGIQRKAKLHCLDCSESLCRYCKEVHQSFKQFRHHKIIPVKDSTQNPCSPCRYKGIPYQAEQFCLHCQELLCNDCKTAHQTFKQSRIHDYRDIAPDKNVLLDAKVDNRSFNVHVRCPTDKNNPQITSCAFLPSGQVALCDRANNLKLLDAGYKVQETLEFSNTPRDLSIINDNTIITVIPESHLLQFVNVSPKLIAGGVIHLNEKPLAVEFVDSEIYVACKVENKQKTGHIQVIDKDGNIQRKLGVKPGGTCLFNCPSHFAVSSLTKRVYVSDRDTSYVTGLSANGDILMQCKSPTLARPRGVYIDAVDNILVCGENSNNVEIISYYGAVVMRRTLIQHKVFIKTPCSIAYRDSDSTLLVGCYGEGRLQVFNVKFN